MRTVSKWHTASMEYHQNMMRLRKIRHLGAAAISGTECWGITTHFIPRSEKYRRIRLLITKIWMNAAG